MFFAVKLKCKPKSDLELARRKSAAELLRFCYEPAAALCRQIETPLCIGGKDSSYFAYIHSIQNIETFSDQLKMESLLKDKCSSQTQIQSSKPWCDTNVSSQPCRPVSRRIVSIQIEIYSREQIIGSPRIEIDYP